MDRTIGEPISITLIDKIKEAIDTIEWFRDCRGEQSRDEVIANFSIDGLNECIIYITSMQVFEVSKESIESAIESYKKEEK